MGTFKGSDHLLICGWSPKGFEIIRELRAKEVEDAREIVILADLETDPVDQKRRHLRPREPRATVHDLLRAGLDRVSTVIVLADASNASDEPDDLDARSLLTTLAIESINPDAYSCVEVIRSENRQHFERTNADELVVSAELTGSLLAASARTHGLTAVIADLLTHPEGQELYRVPVPPEIAGQTVRHALEELKDVHDSLLVGVFTDGSCTVNPPGTTVLAPDDELLVVRARPIASMIPYRVAEHLDVLTHGLRPPRERAGAGRSRRRRDGRARGRFRAPARGARSDPAGGATARRRTRAHTPRAVRARACGPRQGRCASPARMCSRRR